MFKFFLQCRKRIEMEKEMNTRLALAQKRKETMEIERKYDRMNGQIDYFLKHSLFRQKMLEKNTKLYEMFKQEKEKNLEVLLTIWF